MPYPSPADEHDGDCLNLVLLLVDVALLLGDVALMLAAAFECATSLL